MIPFGNHKKRLFQFLHVHVLLLLLLHYCRNAYRCLLCLCCHTRILSLKSDVISTFLEVQLKICPFKTPRIHHLLGVFRTKNTEMHRLTLYRTRLTAIQLLSIEIQTISAMISVLKNENNAKLWVINSSAT